MEGPFVRCEVNTCTHWLPGERCGAANIDILNEEEGRMSENSEQTECKTFYKKSGVTSYLGSMDNVNWGGLVSEVLTPGQQVTPSVTCVVDTCKYWEEGNLCQAGEIRVTGENADECQDTNCGTFLPVGE
ncbi:MAG: DUF1540 domain-containing protein [Bacillota bacterium]|nr:DUF1540 domain-containing protein [Bacillota bacterium]